MTEHVWVSSMLDDVTLIPMFLADIVQKDETLAISAIRQWKAGGSVPQAHCPSAVWPEQGSSKIKDDGKLPPLFVANGYWIVAKAGADVLQQFDLGEGALYPVKVLKSDRKSRFEGEYFCWIFGNTKSSFLEKFSPEAPTMSGSSERNWCVLPIKLKDHDISVSRAALTGPDVWVDPTLFGSVFFSGPLGDALVKAGLKRAFRLANARVL